MFLCFETKQSVVCEKGDRIFQIEPPNFTSDSFNMSLMLFLFN